MKTEKFNPKRKPIFDVAQPQKILLKTAEKHCIDLYDGESIGPSDFREGLKYHVHNEYDLDDGRYYSLIGIRLEEYENPNYEKQKRIYDEKKAEHNKKLKDWKTLKKKWDELQRKYEKDLEQIQLDEFESIE